VNKTTLKNAFATFVAYRVIFILAVTLIVSTIVVPSFFSLGTLNIALDRAATMGIIAVGLTVLLIAGQIDLSGGAVLGLAGIVAMGLQPQLGSVGAAMAGVVAGAIVGAVNGFIVVRLQVNSLVTTLATMLAVTAVSHWITNSQPISGQDLLFGINVSRTIAGLFNFRSLLFLVLIVALHFWLTKTISGRNLFAVGSNALAATASGVRSSRYLFGGFVFAGICSGVAGVILSLSVNTGSPVFGDTLVVTVIAAVVVGGTRLEGGRGSALGTLGGVLTLAALTTAMEFQSVPAYAQQIVTGSILILLILLDRTVAGTTRRTIRWSSLLRRSAPSTTV
jgi:ribose transport system permease protein